MTAIPRSLSVESGRDLREQLSTFYGLFVLSLLMFGVHESDEVLRLATSALPSLGPFELAGADRVVGDGDPPALATWPEGELVDTGYPEDGEVSIDGFAWGWTYELRTFDRVYGHLTAAGRRRPSEHERFLLTAFVHQTSAALSNAAMYQEALRSTEKLRDLNRERSAVNNRLQKTIADLERQSRTHERLSEASASRGVGGLVDALYEITGLPAAVEDQFGNLQAWVGPDEETSPRKASAGRLAEIHRRIAAANGRPIRAGGRLVAWAKPGQDILGTVSLLDPFHRGGGYEIFALEHAATLLAMELAHQRGVAELELRLRRELVEELLDGADSASIYARAAAVGHDLRGPHRVMTLRWRESVDEASQSAAVDRSLTRLGWSWLSTRRHGASVLILRDPRDPRLLYDALASELGPRGSIGVGRTCETPARIPDSYNESVRALSIRETGRSPDGMTSFAELGIYRILGGPETRKDVAAFVQQWLGSLLDYDSRRKTDLVATLAEYLDCGGNYDQTADALMIHRSTLRYRLRRIRDLGGLDLTDVDTRLSLHLATRAWKIIDW